MEGFDAQVISIGEMRLDLGLFSQLLRPNTFCCTWSL